MLSAGQQEARGRCAVGGACPTARGPDFHSWPHPPGLLWLRTGLKQCRFSHLGRLRSPTAVPH